MWSKSFVVDQSRWAAFWCFMPTTGRRQHGNRHKARSGSHILQGVEVGASLTRSDVRRPAVPWAKFSGEGARGLDTDVRAMLVLITERCVGCRSGVVIHFRRHGMCPDILAPDRWWINLCLAPFAMH